VHEGQHIAISANLPGGTRISSTRYVHYGTIDFVLSKLVFQLKTLTLSEASRWAGVVSAAITMSDVKDEIDLVTPALPDCVLSC